MICQSCLSKDLLEKPEQTFSLEPVDEVTTEELEEGKLVRLRSALERENCAKVLEVLKSRISAFAWKLDDIIGIDPTILSHKLNVDPSVKLVK